MKNNNAIVTIATGEAYQHAWKTYCERNWRSYGAEHAYDIICIDRPLDNSPRAQQRSPSWQKCLILGQEFSRQYERIVWIDSDILINTSAAPDIAQGVPLEKVGAVNMYAQPTPAVYRQVLDRMYEYWGDAAMRNYTPDEYHTVWGLPSGCTEVVQCGVLVLSPQHHREHLERVYYQYEEKGGRDWHMEMRPLSYELLRTDAVYWLDGRFNIMWPELVFLYYPFLLRNQRRLTLSARIKRRLARRFGMLSEDSVRRVAVNNAFLNSWFFHLGGGGMADMPLIDPVHTSFRTLTL